jgi:hypothetical protein
MLELLMVHSLAQVILFDNDDFGFEQAKVELLD